MLHHTQRLTAGMLALQTFYSKCKGVHSVPATPIVAAVCGLMNIIMILLSVISSVHRHMTTGGFVKLREVLTSYKFGMSKPPDSLCNERLVSRLQHWVKDFR